MPASIEELGRLQREVMHRWRASIPDAGWVLSHVVWTKVANSTMRELLIVSTDGSERLLAFPETLAEALDVYREALAQPGGGGWPIGIEMRMSSAGEGGMRVIWNDQVWFGFHPGAPLQPPTDPAAEVVPTPEMWALELEMHPRADDALPDWWRLLLDAPLPAEAAPDARADHIPVPRDEALGDAPAPVGAVRAMDGAWGWDRVLDEADEAVLDAIRSADESEIAGDLAPIIGRAQDSLRARQEGEWRAATPIRLLREWNARHGQRDPEGLGDVDPASAFADERRRSIALKQADATLRQILDDLVAQQVRARCRRSRA